MKLWGLNAESYSIDGCLQLIGTVPNLENKGVLPMEIVALVCPDTGDSHTAPVILGTNCIAVHSAFQKFLEQSWTVSSEQVGIPSEFQECSIEIPPGGYSVLRVASSIAPKLLKLCPAGSYVLMETPLGGVCRL